MNRALILLFLYLSCLPMVYGEVAHEPIMEVTPYGKPIGRAPIIGARGGRFYVLDDYTNRLFIYDSSGKTVRISGDIGDGPGQFYKPAAMSITAHSLFIYDRGNARIAVLSLDGEFIRNIPEPEEVFSMAASPGGLIYINNPSSGNLITVLNSEGQTVQKFGALSSVSSLYHSSDTTRDEEYHLQANRVRLAVDEAGRIYAGFLIAPVIRKYSSDGSLLQETRMSGEAARRLSDAFWQGAARSGRLLSGVIDGRQVPFLIKDMAVDPGSKRLVVLTAFSTLFVFEEDLQQFRTIEVRGVFDWQIWKMAVDGRSVWIARTFLPGNFRGELPASFSNPIEERR
jgi:hypothetical protein